MKLGQSCFVYQIKGTINFVLALYVHTYIHTCIHTYAHTHTCTQHTHTYAHTHTNIHWNIDNIVYSCTHMVCHTDTRGAVHRTGTTRDHFISSATTKAIPGRTSSEEVVRIVWCTHCMLISWCGNLLTATCVCALSYLRLRGSSVMRSVRDMVYSEQESSLWKVLHTPFLTHVLVTAV